MAKGENAKIYDTESRELITVADRVNGLYYVNRFLNEVRENVQTNTVKLTLKEKWHRSLGHLNFEYLNRLVEGKLSEGLPEKIENIDLKCANCIKSKNV